MATRAAAGCWRPLGAPLGLRHAAKAGCPGQGARCQQVKRTNGGCLRVWGWGGVTGEAITRAKVIYAQAPNLNYGTEVLADVTEILPKLATQYIKLIWK